MKINRINENTIRVQMDAEELKKRGITVLDLLGDKKNIQNFFYSILKEVDVNHNFQSDDPVTFQVMPDKGGLQLLISKVDKKDISKFQASRDFMNNTSTAEDVIPGSSLDDIFGQSDQAQAEADFNERENRTRRYFKFTNVDDLIELADNLRVADLASKLLYFQNYFVLDLAFLDDNYVELAPSDAWAVVEEYGQSMTDDEADDARQQGKVILPQDALANLRYYFHQKN